jgi:hypothetical protein
MRKALRNMPPPFLCARANPRPPLSVLRLLHNSRSM